MDALLLVIAFQGLAGSAAGVVSKWPRLATVIGASGSVIGCIVGIVPTVRILLGGAPESRSISWDGSHGALHVTLDALSAFFLAPVLVISALSAIYGGNYLLTYRRHKSLGGPWLFFNIFVIGMIGVLIAHSVLFFLMAWEVMSIAAYFLVTFEHEKTQVRQAGWYYLIATHLGVVFLILGFLLMGRHAVSLDFEAFYKMPSLTGFSAGLFFLLFLVGFGAKAGFVPFHVWLPDAHSAAPSHISALMSGVMIKMGFYGLLRILTFLGEPASWWGLSLAGIGLFTAIFGIALALYQRDMKRVLAYSSIENMGLIALALGVGLWGVAGRQPEVAVLGLTAGFLHVWNHALMKGLMFLAAGSVLHSTGIRDIEKLGGLMKRLPWTASIMMTGAVAIAALPPLNGFISKWLMYLTVLKCGFGIDNSSGLIALFAAGFLALISGLTAVTFVRLVGVVLLGSPRSETAAHAHESSPWMLGSMVVLILLCVAVAIVPQLVVGIISEPIAQILGRSFEPVAAPLGIIARINLWTMIAVGTVALIVMTLTQSVASTSGLTWGCGYAEPTNRMQYTGRSFAEMIAEHLLPRTLRPRTTKHTSRGLFPSRGNFHSTCPDPVSEKLYEPFFRRWASRFSRLRFLQHGKVHVYLAYIVVIVVLGLTWVSIRRWWCLK